MILLQVREVGKSPQLVVGEVDALVEVEGGAQVLNLFQLVAPEVQLSLIQRVRELRGLLDQLSCNFH